MLLLTKVELLVVAGVVEVNWIQLRARNRAGVKSGVDRENHLEDRDVDFTGIITAADGLIVRLFIQR